MLLMSSTSSFSVSSPEPVPLEIRVVLHWYTLWSVDQRSKFLNHLRGFYVPRSPALELCEQLDLLWTTSESADTFQCQIKLFDQYFACWSTEERHTFVTQLSAQDPILLQKFRQSLNFI